VSGIRPEAYDTIDNTTHLVAAVFTITGISGIFDSDANSDASLVGSDGVTYQFTDHSPLTRHMPTLTTGIPLHNN